MDYVACRICGSPKGLSGTKLCDGCWEVERRLAGFLKTPEGVLAVCEVLADVDPRFSCLRTLKKDEPVFILRGQDKTSPDVVRIWALTARRLGTSIEKCNRALDTAEKLELWGREHNAKVPD